MGVHASLLVFEEHWLDCSSSHTPQFGKGCPAPPSPLDNVPHFPPCTRRPFAWPLTSPSRSSLPARAWRASRPTWQRCTPYSWGPCPSCTGSRRRAWRISGASCVAVLRRGRRRRPSWPGLPSLPGAETMWGSPLVLCPINLKIDHQDSPLPCCDPCIPETGLVCCHCTGPARRRMLLTCTVDQRRITRGNFTSELRLHAHQG